MLPDLEDDNLIELLHEYHILQCFMSGNKLIAASAHTAEALLNQSSDIKTGTGNQNAIQRKKHKC